MDPGQPDDDPLIRELAWKCERLADALPDQVLAVRTGPTYPLRKGDPQRRSVRRPAAPRDLPADAQYQSIGRNIMSIITGPSIVGPGPGPSVPCGSKDGPAAAAGFDPGPVLIEGPNRATGPEGDDDKA